MVTVLGEGEDDVVCPVNVRTLVNFKELEKKGLKLKEYDESANNPQYTI